MEQGASAGFFGKLPGAGDFVQRRLPQSFVDIWDRCLAAAVAASRKHMGTHEWRRAYLASPVWRFVLAPHVAGSSAWCGILGPGIDRSGRCFPMVVASPLEPEYGARARALADYDWFDAVARTQARAQTDPVIGAEAFDAMVAGLGRPGDSAAGDPLELLRGADLARAPLRIALPSSGGFVAAHAAALWARLEAMERARCLWWTTGCGRVPASLLVTDDLPQSAAYCAFIDATRDVGAWRSIGEFESSHTEADSKEYEPAAPAAAGAQDSPVSGPPVDPLPDDGRSSASGAAVLDEVAALLSAPSGAAVAAQAALRPRDVQANAAVANAIVIRRQACGLYLVAADCKGQSEAAAVADTVMAMPAAALQNDWQALRAQLMCLHIRLRDERGDAGGGAGVDYAVVALRLSGAQASVLRIGAANGWLFHGGQMTPLFAEPPAAPPSASAAGGLEDLLFGNPAVPAGGLGAPAEPSCEETGCAVETGDRLLLLATPQLLQLPPATLARGLALPSEQEVRRHIAAAAGLAGEREWPLAVVPVAAGER